MPETTPLTEAEADAKMEAEAEALGFAVKYQWKRDTYAGWTCEMPENVTLCVSPRRTSTRAGKLIAAPGSLWHAQCSVWEERTRTMSRFGRDAWHETPASAAEAKRLAESIYAEEKRRSVPAV